MIKTSISLNPWVTSGVSNWGYAIDYHTVNDPTSPDDTTNYYEADAVGSERMITSVDGYPVWQAMYAPYGDEVSPQMTVSDYKFAGLTRDPTTGLDQAMLRTYSSNINRWLTPDLLGGDISNPQSLNLYAYALNNPTTLTDPSGLDSMPYQPPTVVNVYGSSPTDFQILPCSYEAIAEAACYGGWSPAPPGWYEGSTSGGTSAPPPAPKPAPPSFTLGLRVPNQTFNQCMTQNATNYSAGGFADLALGTNNVFSNPYAQVATGNTATSLYAGVFGGSASNAAGAATSTTPDLFKTAIGSPLSYGRRTANIMTLNLEGKGGLPLALSPVPEIGELTSALGSVSRAFSLGLDFAEKGAADIGLFGAEAVGCSISQ